MSYKRYTTLTKEEKNVYNWERKGRPVLIWDSKRFGTYIKKIHGKITASFRKKNNV